MLDPYLVKLVDVLYYHLIELMLDFIIFLARILVLHGLTNQIRKNHENLIVLAMLLEVLVQLIHLLALEIHHDASLDFGNRQIVAVIIIVVREYIRNIFRRQFI